MTDYESMLPTERLAAAEEALKTTQPFTAEDYALLAIMADALETLIGAPHRVTMLRLPNGHIRTLVSFEPPDAERR